MYLYIFLMKSNNGEKVKLLLNFLVTKIISLISSSVPLIMSTVDDRETVKFFLVALCLIWFFNSSPAVLRIFRDLSAVSNVSEWCLLLSLLYPALLGSLGADSKSFRWDFP